MEHYEIPVTEMSNQLTNSIDVAATHDIVRTLHNADKEIFVGWDGSKGLFDQTLEATLLKIQNLVSAWNEEKEGMSIILSGCGASGRLAFMISSYFNQLRKEKGQPSRYDYLIAGGDKSLFRSQGAFEDNPTAGRADIQKAATGKGRVLYIGITCGLSSAYVAGQLDFCMDNLDIFIQVLLGFNPTYLAKHDLVEKWNKSMFTVVSRLESLVKRGHGFILNPIIGPEPIAGSTRMKGGTATKILLETLFLGIEGKNDFPASKPSEILKVYQKTQLDTFAKTSKLSQCIDMAGQSLQSGGHIFYIGQNRLGITGMIDASECPPTYGASYEDIRGYVGQSYIMKCNKDGHLENFEKISLDHFMENIFPTLMEVDTIIFLLQGIWFDLKPDVLKSSAKKIIISFGESIYDENILDYNNVCDISLNISPFSGSVEDSNILIPTMLEPLLQEAACKWICNVISTGTHIRKGKVFQNSMVDFRVKNRKLYYRACGIIQKYGNKCLDEAEYYLLRAVYQKDDIDSDIKRLPVSAHIERATYQEKVVPIALLLAITGCTYVLACEALVQNPIIRNAIYKVLK